MPDNPWTNPACDAEIEKRSRAFRRAMSQAPAAVTVTAADDGVSAHGVTISSFTSVSLDPPLCLVCVNLQSPLLPVLRRAGRFATHLLSDRQADTATLFASGAPEARRAALSRTAGEPPRLDDFLLRITFSLWHERPAGDHAVVVGAVQGIETPVGDLLALGDAAFDPAPPALSWWRSRLGSLAPKES